MVVTIQLAEKGMFSARIRENIPQGLKPSLILLHLMYGLKPVPFTGWSFSASGKQLPVYVRAEQAAEQGSISGEIGGGRPSAAKADLDSVGFMRGLKPPPPSVSSFSAVCK